MKFVEFLPHPALNPLVHSFWRFDTGNNESFPKAHEVLPEFCFSVVGIIHPHYQAVRVLAPHTHSYKNQLQADTIFMGIRIQPWIQLTDVYPHPAGSNQPNIGHFSHLRIEDASPF